MGQLDDYQGTPLCSSFASRAGRRNTLSAWGKVTDWYVYSANQDYRLQTPPEEPIPAQSGFKRSGSSESESTRPVKRNKSNRPQQNWGIQQREGRCFRYNEQDHLSWDCPHRRMPLNRKALLHCTPSSEYPVRRQILRQCTYAATWKLLYIPLRSSYLLVPASWELSLHYHSNVQYVINSYKHWYLIQTLVANSYNMGMCFQFLLIDKHLIILTDRYKRTLLH